MKIAWVSAEWPPHQGGIGTYSLDIVTALRRLGHHVEIICYTDGGKRGEKHVWPVLDLKKSNWSETLYKTIRKINPDLVHVQHEYGMYINDEDYSFSLLRTLFKLRFTEEKIPLIMTYHSVYRLLTAMESKYMDTSLNIIDAGIVHERYQFELLPMNIGRVPENVYVIPHGAKKIKPYPTAKRDLGLEGKKIVGMIGWWEEDKGFHRVVEMWANIKKSVGGDWMLVVAGGARLGSSSGRQFRPRLMNAIESSKAKNSIKVIEGAFNPEQYDKILSSFDIMVLPYRRASQSGNLAHGFALGVPAVVDGLEGLKAEIEESRAGLAVAPGDDIELERAIKILMTDDNLREKCSERARKYVTKAIRWDIVAKKHVELYKEVMRWKREEPLVFKKEHGYDYK